MKKKNLIGVLVAACGLVRAEWHAEQYQLKGGWNAIYPFVDASHVSMDELLEGASEIEEVWRWQPEGNDARLPGEQETTVSGQEWGVWVRGDSEGSSFNRLRANYGYLVRVKDGSSPRTLRIVGKAVLPEVRWRSDRAHLVGFPVGDPAPTMRNYFEASGLPVTQTEIFRYAGGAIQSGSNPRVVNPTVTRLTRGEAYWINLPEFSRFYGPLKLEMLSNGSLHFDEDGSHASILLTNQGEDPLTVTLSSQSSETAPSGQSALMGDLPFLIRSGGGGADTPLTGALEITLEPKEKKQLLVILNRQNLPGEFGERSGSVLKFSVPGVQDVFLSSSAVKTSLAGLWVGEIEIDQVGSVLKKYRRNAEGNTILNPVTGAPEVVEDLTTPQAADELPKVKRAYPLKLLIHVDAAGEATLLSHVYSGALSSLPADAPLGLTLDESLIDPESLELVRRYSVTHLPLDTQLVLGSSGGFGLGQQLTGAFSLAHDSAVNPFVHTYHPDHDNLDARFNNALPEGRESFSITRALTLTVDTVSPDTSGRLPGWGSTILTGRYREDVDGVFKETLRSQGVFALKKINSIGSLSVSR